MTSSLLRIKPASSFVAMVGAPVSYSGNQSQPPSATGFNPGAINSGTLPNYTPSPQNGTPNTPMSALLLPYNGQGSPSASAPSPYPNPFQNTMTGPPTSIPLNTSYPPTSFSPNPPTTAPYQPASAAPPPFPPCSTKPSNNPYPPSSMGQPSSPYYAGYPPNSSPFMTNGYQPNSSGINQPQPFHNGQAQPAYPPTGYAPQPNNPHVPSGYPQGTGTYPPNPASTYPQGHHPASQAPHVMGTYSTPAGYPAPPTPGFYPPQY